MGITLPQHDIARSGSGEFQAYEMAVKLGEVVRSTIRRLPTIGAVLIDPESMSRTRIHFDAEGRYNERYSSPTELCDMNFVALMRLAQRRSDSRRICYLR